MTSRLCPIQSENIPPTIRIVLMISGQFIIKMYIYQNTELKVDKRSHILGGQVQNFV